jgi:hypothetical protein
MGTRRSPRQKKTREARRERERLIMEQRERVAAVLAAERAAEAELIR